MRPRAITPRTSASHPIRVDWLRTPGLKRIGLTLAPGKQGASVFGDRPWKRDLDEDLDRLVYHDHVQRLVCLVEDHELVDYRIPSLFDAARDRGVEVTHFPIADQGVPAADGPAQALVRGIAASPQRTVIHCIGGLGRTGTVAGCVLVELGRTAEEALDELAQVRSPHCPENESQRAYVRRYALALAGRAAGP